ncbi:hypothetical protein C2G38_2064991 [Gigaspora rosea]|uniref:Uncharacterized protein n=1 Tax=Gigaspora rosea TaxID=44941 RepID=A0A397VX95_9GLOM|nr:hypothetical protein C2G38_2064991 [Gigaspora rosea]
MFLHHDPFQQISYKIRTLFFIFFNSDAILIIVSKVKKFRRNFVVHFLKKYTKKLKHELTILLRPYKLNKLVLITRPGQISAKILICLLYGWFFLDIYRKILYVLYIQNFLK